ncbi:MAG: hypothetical protein AB1810_09560 [Pseudomonadota bacterium]
MSENTPPKHPNIPLLNDPVREEAPPTLSVNIPVLDEILTQEALEKILSSSFDLPEQMQKELIERITQQVQNRLSLTLPKLMLLLQKEIIQGVHKHIAEALPEILKELGKPDTHKP